LQDPNSAAAVLGHQFNLKYKENIDQVVAGDETLATSGNSVS
jgi:hypothetical protein